MNESETHQQLAIALLDKLGLSHIRLERRKDGSCRYHAWNTPLVDGNGSPRISRQGIIRLKQAR